jgi:outer membrane protein OmpA-like peptidoglycan-associated protein
MRKILVIGVVAVFLLTPLAAYAKTSYFGVPNKALAYPKEFDETEAAITKAEQSPGAENCPEKIAQAKDLARKGVETYWACFTEEAMALLAEARKVAGEAEQCGGAPKAEIILKGVTFALDSAELTPRSKSVLDKEVTKLKEDPSTKVVVQGHTCSLGSETYNQQLSERRAKAVMDYFIAQGIDPDRLKAEGRGEADPIASNATEAGRAQNRRVELDIY